MRSKIADLFSGLLNPRHKVIFLLLLRAEGSVSSNRLAQELGVTPRTIKSDIKQMRTEVAGLGIQIHSKRSEGYWLVMDDQELSRRIREYFQIYQRTTISNEQRRRVHYMIRRLLTSSQPVKTEQIQRELYLNESNSLHRELAEVKSFLQLYHLEVVVRPYRGIEIQGELFYRISCIVRLYRYFHRHSTDDTGTTQFDQYFYCKEVEKSSLRSILHKTLAGSEVVFSDIYSERFLIYLIFFRNYKKTYGEVVIEFPELDFDYRITKEYAMTEELIQKLRSLYQGFDFNADIIRYLTLVAVMSTDLYRFRDCNETRYGSLIVRAEELRNYVLTFLSGYFKINLFDDYTCFKDLLKIMIPISLKQLMRLSDDVDVGFHDWEVMDRKPIINHAIRLLCQNFYQKYDYQFSGREQYLLFTTILGLFNRITLSRYKLKLALIAIDGRLSTQQLKFNLQHYFGPFIERIETKMLYELDSMESPDYDYYLCMEYGKNMNISYSPIYYASEDLSEKEYVTSLNDVFMTSYRYQDILPPIYYSRLNDEFRFQPFQANAADNTTYHEIITGHNHDIRLFFNLDSNTEAFYIYYFAEADAVTLHGEQYVIVVDTKIADNSQKLKMIINVIDRMFDSPSLLRKQCETEAAGYHNLFHVNN